MCGLVGHSSWHRDYGGVCVCSRHGGVAKVCVRFKLSAVCVVCSVCIDMQMWLLWLLFSVVASSQVYFDDIACLCVIMHSLCVCVCVCVCVCM